MEPCNKRTSLGRGYDRVLGRVLPSERFLGVLFCLLLNSLVYWGAQRLTAGLPMLDMTTGLDQRIPFVPWWILIYVGAYAFWITGYVIMARSESWYSIMTAEVIAKVICGMFFLLLPTTNVRPEITGQDVFSKMMGILYSLDAPSNLFPSIHCLESWICFRGISRSKAVPRWGVWAAGIFAVLVCISTLTTYQHVLADVAGGVLLAELLLQLCRRKQAGGHLGRWFAGLDRRLFGG